MTDIYNRKKEIKNTHTHNMHASTQTYQLTYTS